MQDEPTILQRIFALQEQVLVRHIQQFPDLYNFVSRCIHVLSTLGIPKETWAAIRVSHRVVFNFFHGDAVSTLINAIRLCLQGCETDAYALMRVVIENLTILSYIVDSSLYDDAYREIKERAPKGKAFTDRFKYETAINTTADLYRSGSIRKQRQPLLPV